MMPFHFEGSMSASKSIMNRLLVIQSYSDGMRIRGDSLCDDVVHLRASLENLLKQNGQALDCGEAGTTFRFLALRASRIPGTHRLTGSSRLFARPQQALIDVLAQFSVRASFEGGAFVIEGDGWKSPGKKVIVDARQSSQFASSVLLNSWNLNFDLFMSLISETQSLPSEGYLTMTESLVQKAGMHQTRDGVSVRVPAGSLVAATDLVAELDASSAFAVAVLASLGGTAKIKEWPLNSLQPDAVFPELLARMGVPALMEGACLKVEKATKLLPIHVDLGGSPDLFPVLSVLCSITEGTSVLFGAPQLAHKESSRIETSARLVEALGRVVERHDDGMIIHGVNTKEHPPTTTPFSFDPQNDHRMVMAAAVAKLAGFPIQILFPEVVNKSFPEFWSILKTGAGLTP